MKWFVVLLVMTSPNSRAADIHILEYPVFTSEEACEDARPSVTAIWQWKNPDHANVVSSICAPFGRPDAS